MPKQKYFTEEERKIANKEAQRRWREKNKEKRREYNASPRGRAKTMVSHFKRADEKYERGECTITPEWIMENIFTSKCHYCGETDWRVLGCDRIDNNLPHTPENVVCSCGDCNSKRGTMPFAEFVERLKSGETLLKKNVPDKSKPVIALNDAGEVVFRFPSTMEAQRNGFHNSHITDCCNGKQQTHGGLHWQWA